jgi:hypothetical protein
VQLLFIGILDIREDPALSKKTLYNRAKTFALPRPEKAVLRQLIHFADERTGEVWATVPALADETDYCERKVQYALRALEEAGAIEYTGRKHRNHARRLVPIYRLTFGEWILHRSLSGETAAPEAPSDLHPHGRTLMHPHKKTSENKISKEIMQVRKTGDVPLWLRDEFVKDRGERWAASYIDHCHWFSKANELRPTTMVAAKRIQEARRVLERFKITVCGPER